MYIPDKIQLGRNFIGAVSIRSGERQSVSGGGLRARRDIDVVYYVAGVTIAGDGDVLFDKCEMILAKGSRETVVAELSDGD